MVGFCPALVSVSQFYLFWPKVKDLENFQTYCRFSTVSELIVEQHFVFFLCIIHISQRINTDQCALSYITSLTQLCTFPTYLSQAGVIVRAGDSGEGLGSCETVPILKYYVHNHKTSNLHKAKCSGSGHSSLPRVVQ